MPLSNGAYQIISTFMRCSSYCIAAKIDMHHLVQNLINSGMEPRHIDDVVHVQQDRYGSGSTMDVFYFPFGCIIIWGASESEEINIINRTFQFSQDKLSENTQDITFYKVNPSAEKSHIDEEKNEIVLLKDSVFTKFSISYALAQSVKLSALEMFASILMDSTSNLQRELSDKGRISLSKKALSKQVGTLFYKRYSINMHSEILDTPEFFWRRPSYEPIYLMTAEFQDIRTRQNILNRRLDLVQELYNLLSNELNHAYSTRVEMVVVALIAMEVILGLTHLVLPFFYK